MKKILLALSAVAALAVAVPTMASAETVVIKERGMHHHHGWRGARAAVHVDRGLHRGWRHRHHREVIVIKRGHRHHHY